jgi:hypothetical protein
MSGRFPKRGVFKRTRKGTIATWKLNKKRLLKCISHYIFLHLQSLVSTSLFKYVVFGVDAMETNTLSICLMQTVLKCKRFPLKTCQNAVFVQ